MAFPVVVMASGGVPVINVSPVAPPYGATPATVVAANGLGITIVTANGTPMTLLNPNDTPYP